MPIMSPLTNLEYNILRSGAGTLFFWTPNLGIDSKSSIDTDISIALSDIILVIITFCFLDTNVLLETEVLSALNVVFIVPVL